MLLPVDGHHLRTVDLGAGPPLLFHSGWVASWDLWLPTIERLQSRFRCIAYDHRGAGASTFPPGAITTQALVDDVFRVLDAHGLERCVLAGESLGALTCLEAALAAPERFLGLVLVGAFPAAPDSFATEVAAARADWPALVDAFVDACMPERDADAARRWARQLLLAAGGEAAARLLEAHVAARTAPDVAAVAVPTLVLHGALDAISPLVGGEVLAAAIPGARLVVVPDAGHVPPFTRPLETAAAIAEWWSSARPGA